MERIKTIEITMAELPSVASQLADAGRRHPQSRETADHSFYFLPAVVLREGKLTARQFTKGKWNEEEIKSVMDRIVIRMDSELNRRAPGGLPVRLKVVMEDGAQHVAEVLYPPGHPKNRLDKEGIIEKFARYGAPNFDAIAWDKLARAIENLDRAPNPDALLKTVCRTGLAN